MPRLRFILLSAALVALIVGLFLFNKGVFAKPNRMAETMCDAGKFPRGDWAGLCRYAAENRALIASGRRPDVVFIGDSITEKWAHDDPGFFAPRHVNRGQSGQTSQNLLVRFRQDVVALKPRAVHIMVGINDISGLTGSMRPEDTVHDVAAMAEIAKANGIAVVIGSLTPSKAFPWRKWQDPRPEIAELNRRLAAYAKESGAVFVDYHAVLAAPDGALNDPSAPDTLHLGPGGYARIRPLTERALAEALKP